MSISTANRQKKRLACLGCGKAMWTDRCHRLCKKCRRRNDATPACTVYRMEPSKLPAFLLATRDDEER